MLKDRIIRIIDFFYPPFRKLMPLQTFRYAVCGGGNTLWDILVFSFSYHFLLTRHIAFNSDGPVEVVYTMFGTIKAHVAALIIGLCFSFPTGYYLNRHVVFSGSVLKGRIQLFRYFLLVVVCIFLNYIFLNLFVDMLHFYPTLAKIFTTIIVVSFSYVTQKRFTFKSSVNLKRV